MKTKLLIVSWYGLNNVGGLERVTQYMYEAWKEKYDIEIVDLKRVKKAMAIGNRLIGLHNTTDALIMSCYVNILKRNCRKKNIEYKCITQGFNAPFVQADLAFMHGTMRGVKVALEGEKAKWKVNQFLEKICCENSKRVIAVSESVKKEVKELYKIPASKIHTVENCVDTKQFYVDPNAIRNGKYRIIFSGRFEERKGLSKLLDFAKRVEEQNEFELYIATIGEQNNTLFSGLKHTVIKWGLNKDEMRKFYQEGDLMYFPSLYEGFSMVILESLSCGCPVIGTSETVIGDLCAKGIEGTFIYGGGVRFDMLKQLCDIYRKPEKRLLLHDNMEKYYSEEAYKKKLNILL